MNRAARRAAGQREPVGLDDVIVWTRRAMAVWIAPPVGAPEIVVSVDPGVPRDELAAELRRLADVVGED
jgi:hypothetical protein